MKVFNLASGADTAGISVATALAFRRHAPDWDVRSMVATVNYLEYPVDVPWSQKRLEELYDAADVVHVHNVLFAHRAYDNGQGKPTVLHHHGMKSGSGPTFFDMVKQGREIGAVQVGSTLDLAIREPSVEWLPAPANLRELRQIRRRYYRPSRTVRVGHAPTDRSIKGSDAFDRAIAVLGAEGLAVEPVVIERRTWADCLRLKATCDVFFDQPVLGYGSNAIEAWAMGIPVVSGVADPAIRAGMIDRWGVLPFYEASEATLTDALREMVRQPDLRREYSDRGTTHVERWHDERVTVESLKRIYASAPKTTPGGEERRWSQRRRRVVVGGRLRVIA